jgi:hypothetical protein
MVMLGDFVKLVTFIILEIKDIILNLHNLDAGDALSIFQKYLIN